MGRTGYHDKWRSPDGLLLLSGWARRGLTDPQIAENMGIALGTIYEYKKKYPEIAEALKINKEMADMEVENALFKSATGYFKEITKPIVTKTGYEMVTVQEWYPPSKTAQIFWLKNRRPQDWRDKREIDTGGSEAVTIVDDM